METTTLSACALLAMVCFGGCGGGGARLQSEQATYTTTLGQELKDLDDAYKQGIISQQQYETAKENLIRNRTGK